MSPLSLQYINTNSNTMLTSRLQSRQKHVCAIYKIIDSATYSQMYNDKDVWVLGSVNVEPFQGYIFPLANVSLIDCKNGFPQKVSCTSGPFPLWSTAPWSSVSKCSDVHPLICGIVLSAVFQPVLMHSQIRDFYAVVNRLCLVSVWRWGLQERDNLVQRRRVV